MVILKEDDKINDYHVDGQLARANYGNGRGAGCPQPAGSEDFLWDGLALIKRGDERFVNEPHIGGGNPVYSTKGVSYFNDMLGTTLGAKKGAKYSAAALTAFGEGGSRHTFFTGKPEVAGLGHAFLFRNYRASLGKWQTADPLGYPDGWNALAYCGNGVTDAMDLWGAITEHNVSFGWYFEWQGFSVAYNPLLWSYDLPVPKLPVVIWNELAKIIGAYLRGELSEFTPLWDAFLVVENIKLPLCAQKVAVEKAESWFDDVISVEVTSVETLKVAEAEMDVIKTGNGDVLYAEFKHFKVLCLVHMKVVVE